VDVLVIDSVAALVPRAEIEGEMGDSHVGLQARLMSQALRKITGSISRFELHGHLHQSDSYENRCHVRVS
jgi:RecA/RadA recombinase